MTEHHEYEVPDYGDMFTLEEFRDCVDSGCFIDYDGIGHEAWVSGGGKLMMSSRCVSPSTVFEVSEQCTHVVWFNR